MADAWAMIEDSWQATVERAQALSPPTAFERVDDSWLTDPESWGIDPAAQPTLDEVLSVRRERMDEVKQAIADITPDELQRVCDPPSTPGHPNSPHTVLACLHVILNEEWEHHRYAVRDLDRLLTGDY